MSIPVFSSTEATDDIADALDEAGCVVVTGVFDESARMRVRQELSPYMERVLSKRMILPSSMQG